MCGPFYPPLDFQSNLRWMNLLALGVVNLVFILGGAFLNSLAIFVFLSSPVVRKRKCYFLIMVLSCIDLVVVIVVHPLTIFYCVSELTGHRICLKVYHFICFLLRGLSSFTLLTMNIERYIAVVYPYVHQRTMTKGKMLLLAGFASIFVVMFWLLQIYFRNIKGVVIVVEVLFFLLFVTLINTKILIIARKKRMQRALSLNSFRLTAKSTLKTTKDHLRDLKFTLTYIYTIVCWFICYCPMSIFQILTYLEMKSWSQPAPSLSDLGIWLPTLMTMNSTFNCLIFFWRNKTLRNQSMKLLTCFRVQRNWFGCKN